jgi:hypothetical protein
LQAILPEKNHPACGTMPPTRFPTGRSIFLPSSRKPVISFSHSAAPAGYQLPAKAALLSFEDFMVHLLILGSRLKVLDLLKGRFSIKNQKEDVHADLYILAQRM